MAEVAYLQRKVRSDDIGGGIRNEFIVDSRVSAMHATAGRGKPRRGEQWFGAARYGMVWLNNREAS